MTSRNVRALIFLPKTDPFIAWTTRRTLFFLPKGVEMSIPYFHRQEENTGSVQDTDVVMRLKRHLKNHTVIFANM